jgi:hypothetical protein
MHTWRQVVSMVIGPEGSNVDLEFYRDDIYRVTLRRGQPGSGRENGDRKEATPRSTMVADRGDCVVASTVVELVYNDDFDMVDKAEQAIKHQYDPRTREWARSLINVVIEPESFAEGSLRKAYHMKDLSVTGNDSRYVLKMSKDPNESTNAYFVDVQMQMEAKLYADLFNASRPPKRVDFLDAYVLELKDRPDKRICAVEKCKSASQSATVFAPVHNAQFMYSLLIHG